MQLDHQRLAQLMSAKLADAELRETMLQTYSEMLEKRVKELEEEVSGLVGRYGPQVFGEADAATAGA